MAEQHRATAEQWALIERMRHHAEFSAIVELLHRIEALEPAKPNHPANQIVRWWSGWLQRSPGTPTG